MKILAIVPARGGSKRLPNKNILPLRGKPLINWTIEIAKKIPEVIDVLVSTDSEDIASVAKQENVLVPWLRPAELSTDTASSVDVCLHALDWYEDAYTEVDGLLLLQPTTPFRTEESINESIRLFSMNQNRPVVSFSPALSHPMWCYVPTEFGMKPYHPGNIPLGRSQDLPSVYTLNGSIYLACPSYVRKNNSFIGENLSPVLMWNPKESIDIDTKYDLDFAEFILGR